MPGLDDALIVAVLAATLRIATPLLISAMGELVTQRAGIFNLGVEGTMLVGAFAAWAASIASVSRSTVGSRPRSMSEIV